MKHLTILLASVMTIGLSLMSCTKDENADTLIEGKWVYSQKGFETSKGEVLNAFEHETSCGKNYVEFLKNGTVNEGSYYSNGTCELEVDSGSWKRKGNDLTINFPFAGEETAKIVVLNSETLKVKVELNAVTVVHVYKKV